MIEGVVACAGLLLLAPGAALLTALMLRWAADSARVAGGADRSLITFLPGWFASAAIAVDLVALYLLVRFVRWAWQTPVPFTGN